MPKEFQYIKLIALATAAPSIPNQPLDASNNGIK